MLLLIYQRHESDRKGFDKLGTNLKSFQSLQIIHFGLGT